jgi:hypothetical protein
VGDNRHYRMRDLAAIAVVLYCTLNYSIVNALVFTTSHGPLFIREPKSTKITKITQSPVSNNTVIDCFHMTIFCPCGPVQRATWVETAHMSGSGMAVDRGGRAESSTAMVYTWIPTTCIRG